MPNVAVKDLRFPEIIIGDHNGARRAFGHLIDLHLIAGTEPNMGSKNRSWSNALMAENLGTNPASVSQWRNGHRLPARNNFITMLKLFFGQNFTTSAAASELIRLFSIGSGHDILIDVESEELKQLALQQIPAAFRFGVKNNKIDALPESLKSIDNEASNDIYNELKDKITNLIERLKGSNADIHALSSIERLKDGLGTSYGDMRPGVVLSRMRSVEAVRSAFDNEEGRELLFPGQ